MMHAKVIAAVSSLPSLWSRQLCDLDRMGKSLFTPDETRRYLALIRQPCTMDCPGWIIMWNGDDNPKIERCDDCCRTLPDLIRPYDDDVALLTEARQYLLKATFSDDNGQSSWDGWELPERDGFDDCDEHGNWTLR